MAYDVFVSYSREDLARVLPIVGVLQRHGWRVWIDKRILAGTEYHDEIGDHLQDANAVVVVWSKQSVSSMWVRSEATTALDAKKLVPLRLEDVRLPHPFNVIQTIDHFAGGEPVGNTLKLLLKSIEPKAGKPVVRPPKPTAQAEPSARPEPVMRTEQAAAERIEPQVASTLVADTSTKAHSAAEELRPNSTTHDRRPKRIAIAALTGLAVCSLIWMLRTSWAREPLRPSVSGRYLTTMTGTSVPLQVYEDTGSHYPSGWEVVDGRRGYDDLAMQVREPRSGIVLQLIPPGTFLMGSPKGEIGRQTADETQHSVTLTHAFYLGVMEVTLAQQAYLTEKHLPSKWNMPVSNITWEQARAYCESIGCELPTEAQWEYAARGGTTTRWWWGDSPEDGSGNANVLDEAGSREFRALIDFMFEDGYGRLAPVGQFEPNPFGLHDMIGNVWEWCQDKYVGDYGPESRTDPLTTHSTQPPVARGGSFACDPSSTRSAYRLPTYTAVRSKDVRLTAVDQTGFRVALTLR